MEDEGTEGELLTVRQVAERLGVDEKTVYGYEQRGVLAAQVSRQGLKRRLLFTAAAVDAFAQEHGIAVR